jgi:hypothetical protein
MTTASADAWTRTAAMALPEEDFPEASQGHLASLGWSAAEQAPKTENGHELARSNV